MPPIRIADGISRNVRFDRFSGNGATAGVALIGEVTKVIS